MRLPHWLCRLMDHPVVAYGEWRRGWMYTLPVSERTTKCRCGRGWIEWTTERKRNPARAPQTEGEER